MIEESIHDFSSGGILRFSGIRRKATKFHQVSCNRKEQAVAGKGYTEEQFEKLSAEEVDKLFSIYGVKISGQMVKSLSKSFIRMYSMAVFFFVSGMSNQDTLSEKLKPVPFLNFALERLTCELYYRFSSLLSPLTVGLITSEH